MITVAQAPGAPGGQEVVMVMVMVAVGVGNGDEDGTVMGIGMAMAMAMAMAIAMVMALGMEMGIGIGIGSGYSRFAFMAFLTAYLNDLVTPALNIPFMSCCKLDTDTMLCRPPFTADASCDASPFTRSQCCRSDTEEH